MTRQEWAKVLAGFSLSTNFQGSVASSELVGAIWVLSDEDWIDESKREWLRQVNKRAGNLAPYLARWTREGPHYQVLNCRLPPNIFDLLGKRAMDVFYEEHLLVYRNDRDAWEDLLDALS